MSSWRAKVIHFGDQASRGGGDFGQHLIELLEGGDPSFLGNFIREPCQVVQGPPFFPMCDPGWRSGAPNKINRCAQSYRQFLG